MSETAILTEKVSDYITDKYFGPIERKLEEIFRMIQNIGVEVSTLREEISLMSICIVELLHQEKYGIFPYEFFSLSYETKIDYLSTRFKITEKLAKLIYNFYMDIRMW